MKKGDKVKVYLDPVTKSNFEGIAVLEIEVRPQSTSSINPFEFWYVRFDESRILYPRFISKSDVIDVKP